MLSRLVLAAVIRSIWSPSCFERGATSGPALGARRLQAILALPSVALLFFRDRGEFILPFQVFAGSARNQLTAIRGLQAILALPFVALLFFCARREFLFPLEVFAGSTLNEPTAIRAKRFPMATMPNVAQRIATPATARKLAFLAAPLVQHLL